MTDVQADVCIIGSGHLAPGVGRAVADLFTRGAAGVPIAAFDIARLNGDFTPAERLGREYTAAQAEGVSKTTGTST